jgi:hypothetical protein
LTGAQCERVVARAGRIGLERDGDWLTADGTTLGADDGIGVAAMMALAEDESSPHGPLELLMTVNEEVGGPVDDRRTRHSAPQTGDPGRAQRGLVGRPI